MRKFRIQCLWVLFHVAALVPLIFLIWDFTRGGLTANPIQVIQLRTGNYALIFLMLSLACTPVNIVTGIGQVLKLRRPLGLYAMLYASLHFLNYIGLDFGFNFRFIRDSFFEKPYILVGFAAWLILLPLAITSTRGWTKRLGKKWQQLHWLVYPASVLVVTHFTLQVKADFREAIIYWALLLVLFIVRLPPVKKMSYKLRGRQSGSL